MDEELQHRIRQIDQEKFPTRENCDLSDPKEMFWWMFPHMPGNGGAAFMMPPSYYALVSWHQHDLGARMVCDNCGHQAEPTKKLLLPNSGDTSMFTGIGNWVDIDTAEPDLSPLKAAVDALTPADAAALFAELDSRRNQGGKQ